MISIILLLILIVGTLFLVNYIDQWQKRNKRRLMQKKYLRLQIEELEDVLQYLETTVPGRDVDRQVNREILMLLQELRDLERGDTDPWDTYIAQVEGREAEWAEEESPPPLRRLFESDSEIVYTQEKLGSAIEVLRKRHGRAQLEREDMEVYVLEVNWAQLMVSVISLVGQGHKSFRREKFGAAMDFYKKAQSLLIGHSHPDPKRTTMINELSEIITGERKALSLELMPEDDYNPTQSEVSAES